MACALSSTGRWPSPDEGVTGAPSIGQAEALRRHPAGRSWDPDIDTRLGQPFIEASAIPRPMGPDDDLEFLEELTRRIRDADSD